MSSSYGDHLLPIIPYTMAELTCPVSFPPCRGAVFPIAASVLPELKRSAPRRQHLKIFFISHFSLLHFHENDERELKVRPHGKVETGRKGRADEGTTRVNGYSFLIMAARKPCRNALTLSDDVAPDRPSLPRWSHCPLLLFFINDSPRADTTKEEEDEEQRSAVSVSLEDAEHGNEPPEGPIDSPVLVQDLLFKTEPT